MRIEKTNLPADGITYPGTTGAEPLGMPIGGIGTSTFEIGRDGAFKNNRLQNGWTTSLPQRPKGIDDGSFISVCVSRENGQGIGRIMQLDAPGGLPGLPGLKYTGRFPFVDLDYDDPQFPAAVRLEVFSPFIPLNSDDSSLPIAFFTVKIHNPGDKPIRAGAAMSWVNDIVYENYFRGWAAIGNRNEIAGHGGAPAVRMTTLDDALAGSEYLLAGIKQKGVRWQAVADWRPQAPGRVIGRNLMVDAGDTRAMPGFQPLHAWRTFLERGRLPPESRYDDGLGRFSQHKPIGAVAGTVTVAPGATREIPFALSWFFPHHYDRISTGRMFLGHRYAVRFPGGAVEVLRHAAPRRAELRERSQSWRRQFADCTLPPALRAMLLENLYLLPRLTWWLADDTFYMFESIDCPRVTATILNRYYAAVMAALFPDLHARLLRGVAAAQLPSGEIPSTLGINSIRRREYRIFNSGDAAIFPLAVAWQARWNNDQAFAAEMYPILKKTLQWAVRELDGNGDGIPDVHGLDQGWDDFTMFGCVAYIADQWLAALKAGEALARRLGDARFAGWCRQRSAKASSFVENTLWNGKYYNLSADPLTGEASKICFTDQFTYGTVAARMLDLPDIHPAERVRAALESIWKMNIQPAKFIGRAASNPDGTPANRPGNDARKSGPSQSNCFSPVMIVPLACAAMQHGMFDQALALLDEMAGTLIHRLRDPWSARLMFDSRDGKWFYGMHYSDCLIGWDLLYVMLGLTLDAPAASMTFRPPRLPARLPVFGKLFTGVATIGETGMDLHNSSERPALFRKITVNAPDGRQIAAENLSIQPGGVWKSDWGEKQLKNNKNHARRISK